MKSENMFSGFNNYYIFLFNIAFKHSIHIEPIFLFITVELSKN